MTKTTTAGRIGTSNKIIEGILRRALTKSVEEKHRNCGKNVKKKLRPWCPTKPEKWPATRTRSLRVAGECIVGNTRTKKHKKEPGFQKGIRKNTESRRQRFEDDEEAFQAGLRSRLTKSGHNWAVAWRKKS